MAIKKNKTVSPQKNLSRKIADTLILYAKTQLLLVVLVTVTSWIILSLLGVQYYQLLAILTGVVSVIPVLGITISAVIVAIVATFDSTRFLPSLPVLLEGFAILVIYGILNITIDYILSPYLTGKITKVHPLLLVVAVVLGSIVFGIPGALFAVPVVLVVKTILDHYNKDLHRT
jgi:predicted PurR-regulated permease PerM